MRAKNATGIEHEPPMANFRCRWMKIKFKGKERGREERGEERGGRGKEKKRDKKKVSMFKRIRCIT